MLPRAHHDELTGPPESIALPTWVAAPPRPRASRLRPIHVVLFLATLFTTTLAGSFQAGVIAHSLFHSLLPGESHCQGGKAAKEDQKKGSHELFPKLDQASERMQIISEKSFFHS